jgi:hypothetical protein
MGLFRNNWTPYTDILVFNYGYCSYLLQGKRNRITNRKKFKVTKCGGSPFSDAKTDSVTEEKLFEKQLFIRQS